MTDLAPYLILGEEVRAARGESRPMVALESTIVAHGFLRPRNLEVGRRLEATVRDVGAVPATIAVLDGKIHVGLSDIELARVAEDDAVEKLSRRDLAIALAKGTSGATTVSATMAAAHLAGIQVFATGGIGGVHRGMEATLDISADLVELARTPITVISAGAKAILDLPRTLEYLETARVPVIGYRTDDFPAFWCRSSGLKVPARSDDIAELAQILAIKHALGDQTGTLIANPIPEAVALDREMVEAAIVEALAAADKAGISGKSVTPFLLKHLNEATGGITMDANQALAENNARLGAKLASSMAGAG